MAKLFGKDVPDDLNKWSRDTFKDINRIFNESSKNLSKALKKKEASKVKEDKPERETVITSDDLTNLKIALETANSVEDFLGKV